MSYDEKMAITKKIEFDAEKKILSLDRHEHHEFRAWILLNLIDQQLTGITHTESNPFKSSVDRLELVKQQLGHLISKGEFHKVYEYLGEAIDNFVLAGDHGHPPLKAIVEILNDRFNSAKTPSEKIKIAELVSIASTHLRGISPKSLSYEIFRKIGHAGVDKLGQEFTQDELKTVADKRRRFVEAIDKGEVELARERTDEKKVTVPPASMIAPPYKNIPVKSVTNKKAADKIHAQVVQQQLKDRAAQLHESRERERKAAEEKDRKEREERNRLQAEKNKKKAIRHQAREQTDPKLKMNADKLTTLSTQAKALKLPVTKFETKDQKSSRISKKKTEKLDTLKERKAYYEKGKKSLALASSKISDAADDFVKGANLGDPSCFFELGKIYTYALGSFPQNLELASRYFRQAFEHDNGAKLTSELKNEANTILTLLTPVRSVGNLFGLFGSHVSYDYETNFKIRHHLSRILPDLRLQLVKENKSVFDKLEQQTATGELRLKVPGKSIDNS